MESLNIFDFQKTNIYDLFMIIIKKSRPSAGCYRVFLLSDIKGGQIPIKVS